MTVANDRRRLGTVETFEDAKLHLKE